MPSEVSIKWHNLVSLQVIVRNGLILLQVMLRIARHYLVPLQAVVHIPWHVWSSAIASNSTYCAVWSSTIASAVIQHGIVLYHGKCSTYWYGLV